MDQEFDYTQIENYVKGEMAEKKRHSFEQEVATNKVLAEEVRLYKEVAQVAEWQGLFEEAEEEMQQGKKKNTSEQTKVVQMTPTRKSMPIRRYLSLAASLAVFVIAGVFLWQNINNAGQNHFAEYYQAYPNDIAPITKGEVVPLTDLEQALQTYERKDYAEALALFQALPAQNDTTLFYSSIIALELNDTQKAIQDFASIRQNTSSSFQQAAEWYLALAYLKNGAEEDAKSILAAISSNERHLFYRKAIKLAEKL